jgi:Fe(3+) dicitrate transport protein
MGFEPRWAMRWDHEPRKFSHQLSVGARGAYELVTMFKYIDDAAGRLQTQNADARAAAYAGYVNEKLLFLDGDLTLDVGMRIEYIQLAFRSNLEDRALRRNFWAPLPAASLWYAPRDEVAIFLAYGRSFGPPQYLQLHGAPSNQKLEPETSNSLELGVKILELGGIYGESTVWYKDFTWFLDVGEDAFDLIPKVYLWGVESELEWLPSEVWDMPGELSFYVGYGWTGSNVITATNPGVIMPWYPVHEAWGGGSYEFDFGTSFGVDAEYSGMQYTDYENRDEETPDGAYGPIPAYTLVNIWMRTQTALPNGWRLEFGGGVKNVGDVLYFSRTDDRNAGILAGRPRTYYLSVGFAHDFLPKELRESRKRRARAGRTTRQIGSGLVF